MVETGIVGPKFGFDEVVAIKIHECDLAVLKLIGEARLVYKQFRVAVMPWALTYAYRGCVEA